MPMNENEEIKRDKHRILVLQRALLLQARRQHLPIDVITPERRVQRWIEDAEESLKPVEYDPQPLGSYRDVFDADGEQ